MTPLLFSGRWKFLNQELKLRRRHQGSPGIEVWQFDKSRFKTVGTFKNPDTYLYNILTVLPPKKFLRDTKQVVKTYSRLVTIGYPNLDFEFHWREILDYAIEIEYAVNAPNCRYGIEHLNGETLAALARFEATQMADVSTFFLHVVHTSVLKYLYGAYGSPSGKRGKLMEKYNSLFMGLPESAIKQCVYMTHAHVDYEGSPDDEVPTDDSFSYNSQLEESDDDEEEEESPADIEMGNVDGQPIEYPWRGRSEYRDRQLKEQLQNEAGHHALEMLDVVRSVEQVTDFVVGYHHRNMYLRGEMHTSVASSMLKDVRDDNRINAIFKDPDQRDEIRNEFFRGFLISPRDGGEHILDVIEEGLGVENSYLEVRNTQENSSDTINERLEQEDSEDRIRPDMEDERDVREETVIESHGNEDGMDVDYDQFPHGVVDVERAQNMERVIIQNHIDELTRRIVQSNNQFDRSNMQEAVDRLIRSLDGA